MCSFYNSKNLICTGALFFKDQKRIHGFVFQDSKRLYGFLLQLEENLLRISDFFARSLIKKTEKHNASSSP